MEAVKDTVVIAGAIIGSVAAMVFGLVALCAVIATPFVAVGVGVKAFMWVVGL